jgi:hypothetical protein
MSLKVPAPSTAWSTPYQIRVNQTIEANDLTNRKKGQDVELGAAEKLILRSSNGARWEITVSNAGAVAAVAL